MLFIMLLLPIIGVVQVIGAIVRGLRIEDWTTAYALGLRNYYFAVLLVAGILFMLFDERQPDSILLPMILLSGSVAVYYWIVIYALDRGDAGKQEE